jgi:hypothetical protein
MFKRPLKGLSKAFKSLLKALKKSVEALQKVSQRPKREFRVPFKRSFKSL